MRSKCLIVVILIAAIILAGCDKEESVCPPEYLEAPLFVSPADLAHVNSLTPELKWEEPVINYPYSPTGTCHPEKYRITVKKGPLFVEAMGMMVDWPAVSWTTPALETGGEYRWSVSAMSGVENGPFSGTRKFFVGANCSESASAPTLLMPFNGQMIIDHTPTLVWQNNSDCIPFPYRIEIATDAEFSNTVQNILSNDASNSYTLADTLTNCTTYFWRVAASAGTDLETYSDTYSFRVAAEGCEAQPGVSNINGLVWRDICTLAEDGSVPKPMPFGCQPYGDHSAIANGNIDPGESGIADVIIHIGAGTCDANTPLGLVQTNEEGRYFLWGLTEGTYCVWIDPAENPIWLGSGWWTYPQWLVGQTLAKWQIALGADENKTDVNFGWQFENGGPNPFNFYDGYVYNDICLDTGGNYQDPLQEGCTNSFNNVRANCHRDEGETGIPGVKVELHDTTCDGNIITNIFTDENGYFYFMLPPGHDYCAVVHSQTSPNNGILLPGVWSSYPTNPDNELFWMGSSAGSAVEHDWFNFCWDYMDDQGISPIEIPKLYPKWRPDFEIACRAGPAESWQAWAYLEPGMEFQIMGINPTRNWIMLQPARLLNPEMFPNARVYEEDMICWVPLGSGTTEGDLGDLEIHKGPTGITPTTPPACSTFTTERTCEQVPTCVWKNVSNVTVLYKCVEK